MDLHQETLRHYTHYAQAYLDEGPGPLDQEACSQFLRHIPEGGKILDAGCGQGRDLLYFRKQGFDAQGVEGCPQFAEAARSLTGLPVQTKDLLFLSLPKESLDGIWCHRTLNHFSSEGCRRLLAQFFFGLKPKGILFVSIEKQEMSSEADQGEGPVQSIRRPGPDPTQPAQIIYPYHADDIASLLRQHGFQILAQGQSNPASTNEPARGPWATRSCAVGFIAQRL